MSHTQPKSGNDNVSESQFQVGFAILLLVSAFAIRFAPLPENFACFGALSVFCGYVLRGSARWLIPLAGFFVADCVGHFMRAHGMGFYHLPSMLLNYLGFASMIAIGMLASRIMSRREPTLLPWSGMVIASLLGSMTFFVISNFGAWLDPVMGYEKSLSGLTNCYLMGLPFFRATFASDVCFGCAFYALYRAARMAVLPYSATKEMQ